MISFKTFSWTHGWMVCEHLAEKYILHSSDTGEKMEVQWDCTSAIYRFQESLRFS
jgi:hypothetical protein